MLPQRQEQKDPNEQIIETSAVEKSVAKENEISQLIGHSESEQNTTVQDEVSLDNVPKEDITNNINNDSDSYSYEPVVRERSKNKEAKKPGRARQALLAGTAVTALAVGAVLGVNRGGNENTNVDATDGDNSAQIDSDYPEIDADAKIAGANKPNSEVPQETQIDETKSNPVETSNGAQGTTSENPNTRTNSPVNDSGSEVTDPIQESPVPDNESDTNMEAYPGEKAVEIGLKLAEDVEALGPSVGLIPDTQLLSEGVVSSVYLHRNGMAVTISGKADEQGKLVKSASPLNGWQIGLSNGNSQGLDLKYNAELDKIVVTVYSEGAFYTNYKVSSDPRETKVNTDLVNRLSQQFVTEIDKEMRKQTVISN